MRVVTMAWMRESYFITATGTDLGKTWLTAGIVAACRARGVPVRALKPVMSGFDANQSCRKRRSKSRRWRDGRRDCRHRALALCRALSPDLAAAREGRQIDFAALVDWCRAEIDANNRIFC